MKRPTISDLASGSGVSVSTVNRLLNGSGSVRQDTINRILDAAEDIGFYGLGAIKDRKRAALPHFNLGFLLQQSNRELYQMFDQSMRAACQRRTDVVIEPVVSYADDLAPAAIVAHLQELAHDSDAVSLIAADHPIISQAINSICSAGVPVVTFMTDISAELRAGYVGADNWKLGRTAAWIISQMTPRQGKLAVFIGHHRYQCQDISDASFRSFIRENAPHLSVIDSIPTYEEPENAYVATRSLIEREPDLAGIYVSGGGISGVMRAMDEIPADRQRTIRVVCRDIGSQTRKGLSEGHITASLCHPIERSSDKLVDVMLKSFETKSSAPLVQGIVPFEIITPENV